MSTGHAAGPSWSARLVLRWRMPLYRNGYSLLLNSVLTAVLGLAYWMIAARLYTPAAVGIGAALITAMSLIGDLSHLNLRGALNRFLPSAGAGAARFARTAYLIALTVAGVASVAFVAGIDVWSPSLGVLNGDPAVGALFVLSTMGWAIFVLEGSTLTGIRRAHWVPVQNLGFAVVKIGLLALFAAAMPTLGVFVSWSIPVIALIVPVGFMIFRRLIPVHVRETRDRAEHVPVRGLVSYIAADYVAFLLWTATVGILPLVVLNVLGAEDAAYYYLAWTIAYGLYMVTSSMCDAMMAEAALDPARLRTYCRQAMVESSVLVIPAALIVAAGAPLILRLMGDEYAEEGTTALRLLALSAIPYIVIGAYVRVRSIQRRMRSVVLLAAVVCGIVIGVAAALIQPLGVAGVAVAWVCAMYACAAGIAVGYVTGSLRSGSRGRVLRAASGMAWRARRLPRRGADRAALCEALREAAGAGASEAAEWVVHRELPTPNEVAVALVGPGGRGPAAVLKRARSPRQDGMVARSADALGALHGNPALTRWAGALIPRVLASGRAGERRFVVETLVPGVPSERALLGGDGLGAAAAAVSPLHAATAAPLVVDEDDLRRRVREPVSVLGSVVRGRSRNGDAAVALERLEAELSGALAGRAVRVGWVHGDLCPGNVLVHPASGEVVGLVELGAGPLG